MKTGRCAPATAALVVSMLMISTTAVASGTDRGTESSHEQSLSRVPTPNSNESDLPSPIASDGTMRSIPGTEVLFGPDDALVLATDKYVVEDVDERTWSAAMPDGAASTEAVVSKVIAEHPDVLAGAAFTSGYQSLEVYATDSMDSAVMELNDRLRATDAAPFPVVIVPSQQSMSDYEANLQYLSEAVAALGLKATVSFNGVDGKMSVAAAVPAEKLTATEAKVDANVNALLGASRFFGSARIPIEMSELPADFDLQPARSRMEDQEYWTMGAAIGTEANGYNNCTLGPPITIDGRYYAATAGHCGTGPFYNNSKDRWVGTTHSNQFAPFTDKMRNRGDWQLITGSHYSLFTYTGGQWDGLRRSAMTGNFEKRAVGSQLCSSGKMTGQYCRYFVLEHGTLLGTSIGDVGMLTFTKHDQDLDGVGDCMATVGGDSGGPWYHAVNGELTVDGFTWGAGGNLGAGNTGCRYYMTRLETIRLYYPKAQYG